MNSTVTLNILAKDIELAQPFIKKYEAILYSEGYRIATYHLPTNDLDRSLCVGLIELHIPYVLSIDYSDGSTVRHTYGFSQNGEVIETFYHSKMFYAVLMDGVKKQVGIQWDKQFEYRQIYKAKQLLKGDLCV